MNYICHNCHKKYPINTRAFTCECGGLFDLDYSANFELSKIKKERWNIFRYAEFLPIICEDWKSITMGEGMTPIVDYQKKIKLKIDYLMPTLSFKDRGAAIMIALCKQLNIQYVLEDSSGMQEIPWQLMLQDRISNVKFSSHKEYLQRRRL